MPVEIKRKTKAVPTGVTLSDPMDDSPEDRNVLVSRSLDQEDEFEDLYGMGTAADGTPTIIRPPYPMSTLYKLVNENNALGQAIAAYEVNIDGTGYEVENKDKEKETDEQSTVADGIKDFFDEVYPGESFVTVRRALRKDIEISGNGYLEVLRAADGSIAMLKHVQALGVRLVKLDEAYPEQKVIRRNGKDEKVTVAMRQRRFVQKVGSKLIYFKEFGCSRALDKSTGRWANEGVPTELQNQATELLSFTAEKDSSSPYGKPRWISQTPSVLGSRKSEELNLDFFDAGGLPPALIILMGGQLMAESKKELQTYLTGKGASKHRAAIVEAHSSGGSIDKELQPKVMVERFGDRPDDAMFMEYDKQCEQKVRASFRLPPLFVGKADDYSYASTYASYTVAEAQVFAPERTEFDEKINVSIMREMAPDYKFVSNPLSVSDSDIQLRALDMVKDSITGESMLETINELARVNVKLDEDKQKHQEATAQAALSAMQGGVEPKPKAQGRSPQSTPTDPPAPAKEPIAVSKADAKTLANMATTWAAFTEGTVQLDAEEVSELELRMDKLPGDQREVLDQMVLAQMLPSNSYDPEGAQHICGVASEIINSGN